MLLDVPVTSGGIGVKGSESMEMSGAGSRDMAVDTGAEFKV
jgi:hypothetical protein